jgi:dihydroflavonol-4-reductase
MFATLDTGLNLIHVADVARGHLLAARLGRVGEKYILGAENISLSEIFHTLEEITAIRTPRVRIAYAWTICAPRGLAHATGRPAPVPLTGVRMARKHMYFSADKAVADQVFQRPVEQAQRHAVVVLDCRYAPRRPRRGRAA